MSIDLRALPELEAAIAQLAALAAPYGIRFTTADFGGYRTEADTAQILAYRDADYAAYVDEQRANGLTPVSMARFRPIAPYGSSWHDYGAARDLRITSKPASMSTDDAIATLGALAPAAGLRWGGTFKNPDPPHFELPITLGEVGSMWDEYSAGNDDGSSSSSSSTNAAPIGALLVLGAIALPALVRALRRQA